MMPYWHNTKNIHITIVINGLHHVRIIFIPIISINEVISLLPTLSENHNAVLFAKIWK